MNFYKKMSRDLKSCKQSCNHYLQKASWKFSLGPFANEKYDGRLCNKKYADVLLQKDFPEMLSQLVTLPLERYVFTDNPSQGSLRVNNVAITTCKKLVGIFHSDLLQMRSMIVVYVTKNTPLSCSRWIFRKCCPNLYSFASGKVCFH